MRRSKAKDGTTVLDGGALTLASAINAFFPIGSIYMTTVATNPGSGSPAQFPGTTWVAWGAGRAVVGVGSNGTNTYTVEQTWGADSITLTDAQSGVNNHWHNDTLVGPVHTHSLSAHTHTMFIKYQLNTTTGGTGTRITEVDNVSGGTGSTGSATSAGPNTPSTGAGSDTALTGGVTDVTGGYAAATAHENRQTSIATYLWKRTA